MTVFTHNIELLLIFCEYWNHFAASTFIEEYAARDPPHIFSVFVLRVRRKFKPPRQRSNLILFV